MLTPFILAGPPCVRSRPTRSFIPPAGIYGAAQQEALWLYYEVFSEILLEIFFGQLEDFCVLDIFTNE